MALSYDEDGNVIRVPKLDKFQQELLEIIRTDSKDCPGVNGIRACIEVRKAYSMGIAEAKKFIDPLMDIVYLEKKMV